MEVVITQLFIAITVPAIGGTSKQNGFSCLSAHYRVADITKPN
jgi:hypothetical protein